MSRRLKFYDYTIEYGLISILIFTPLAKGTVETWSILVVYFITLIMFIAWLLKMNFIGKFRIKRTPLDYPILALLVLAVISTIFSSDYHKSISTWPKIITYFVLFYLVVNNIDTREKVRRVAIIIICVGAFLSIFGLIKYLSGIDGSKAFISSTYANRNHFAGYLEMAIPMSVGMFYAVADPVKRIILGYVIILMIVALVLSLSRGGWAALTISMVIMGILLSNTGHSTSKVWLPLTFLPAILVILAMLGTNALIHRISETKNQMQNLTNDCRIMTWKGTIDIIKDYPLTGTGVGTFASVFPKYKQPQKLNTVKHAHNDYLHITSEMGILTFPFIIWLIFATLRSGINRFTSKNSKLRQWILMGAMAGIVAMLIHSLVDFNLHIPANAILFIVLGAIIVSKTDGIKNVYE